MYVWKNEDDNSTTYNMSYKTRNTQILEIKFPQNMSIQKTGK